ncbi:41 kDa spicule matrix protein-like [Dioscorea cayenensis subsp. rotundata]|uniref:41 kDa spicule matrix protein-like n=1 Tax=Dioscorea cayennensis subsp. rotundata TaxID=55577 RepID=A0AB40CC81_DIOCR|nr:41 kDa spicule matrix protein-like [Dioscorea cayenensis subsp. rotundata]
MVLVLVALVVFTNLVEGRNIKKTEVKERKEEKYEPETFGGLGNFFGTPGGVGDAPGLGFGSQPGFGSFPGVGNMPGMPGAGVGGQDGAMIP